MKIYFSNWFGFENYAGVHLLPETLGYPEKKKNSNSDDVYNINFQVYYVKSKNVAKKIGDLMVLSPGIKNMKLFFEANGREIEQSKVYDVSRLFTPDKIVSMPNNIDYYKAISSLFKERESIFFLKLLCDVSYYSKNLKKYQKWDGFDGLFYRNNSSSKSILKKGLKIATGSYEITDVVNITLDDLGESFESIVFNFNKFGFFTQDINLIIGKNGVGKTHILKEICNVVTGLKSSKTRPLFNKLIVVSYSPFETFFTNKELIRLFSDKYGYKDDGDITNNPLSIDDYTYIGFRDTDGRFDIHQPVTFSAKSIANAITYDNDIAWWVQGDSGKLKTIFSTLSLSMSFDTIRFKTIKGRDVDVSMKNNKIEFNDEDEEINYHEGVKYISNGSEVKMSSGQQIYSFMIPSIVSEIQDETLIIIDEPELYLHPALEVGLIEMLKSILKQTNSYAIIATHSAIIAREVQSRCVSVLKEATYGTKIDKPTIETYGESLDEILGEIFDDYSIKKPYQYELDKVIDNNMSLEESLKSFSHRVGDDGLIYLASKVNDEKFKKGGVE